MAGTALAPYESAEPWAAEAPDDREMARREQERLQGALRAIADAREAEADRRVGIRQPIERRWLTDLQQYHGIYDPETQTKLKKGKKSRQFINATAPKTDTMSARLMDLLFPTDDKNWGIGPTPVPEMAANAKKAARARALAEQQVDEMEAEQPEQEDQPPNPELDRARRLALEAIRIDTEIRGTMAEARRRADAMAEEIDDQLKECGYQAAMRDLIEDACKLGTGIAKGPVKGDARQSWSKIDDPTAATDAAGQPVEIYELQMADDPAPAFHRVDPWHCFPDPDARTPGESESWYERHLLKRKGLQRLAKQPGFDPDAIRRVLKGASRSALPQFIADLRSITGESQADTARDYYTVWEFHGPLEASEIETLATMFDQPDMLPPEESDPLDEVNVCLWFCQGEVLKFGIYPLDSNEPIYSVFNLKKDEAGIFGYGIPFIMRQPQSALNAGWRMMLDNAGLSTGPQIVVDTRYVEPADNSWELTPRKVWKVRADAPQGVEPFRTYTITSNQQELAGIIELASKFIDEVTGMPMIAQGEQGQQTTQTMGGMSILMNSANVVFRRIVKNFDDDMTTPNIRRLYHWNMQHSPKDYIKGDMKVDARGSSVLLVREMQAQNLMAIALNIGGHPVYGPMLKHRELLVEIFKAHLLAADKLVLSEQEIAQLQQGQQADPEQDPRVIAERIRQETAINVANLDHDGRVKVATLNYDSTMAKLAETRNAQLDGLDAAAQKSTEERDSKERMFAAELAQTRMEGPSGGGNF